MSSLYLETFICLLFNKKLERKFCSHRTNVESSQSDTFIFVLPKNIFSCVYLKMTKDNYMNTKIHIATVAFTHIMAQHSD